VGISDFLFDAPLARIETVGLFWFSSNNNADSEIETIEFHFTKSTKILGNIWQPYVNHV